MKWIEKIKTRRFFIRLFNWEYWPFQVIYVPVYPVWLWYCLKARSLFFFGASNPGIRNAGFLMESKKEIDELIPCGYKPATLLFASGTPPHEVAEKVGDAKLSYPLILKPDIGMQGKAVVKVNSADELLSAASQFTIDYIVQPYIGFPRELGIFYIRLPNEEKGRITGIVEKKFLEITGDGLHTVRQLLSVDPRHILQLPVLERTAGTIMDQVPEKGQRKVLIPYGNHARGALFLNRTNRNSRELEAVIDAVCTSIRGFYFGRLDIRFNSFDELAANKNWCIVELNGAGSEPTHMYDPGHSLFFAWHEIIRHWKMLYRISELNKRQGVSYLNFSEGIAMLKANRLHVKKLDLIQFGTEPSHGLPVMI